MGFCLLFTFFTVALYSVSNLTHTNFHEHLNDHDFTLVHFHSPWCKSCQDIFPLFKKLDKRLQKRGIDITLRHFNSKDTDNAPIAAEYKVYGHPTFLWFENGEKEAEYKGDRTVHDMFTWIKKQGTPAYKMITKKEWKNLEDNHDFVVWGKINEEELEKEDIFDEVAEELGGKFTFYKTVVDEGESKVVLRRTHFKHFDGPVRRVFKRKRWGKLDEWLQENTFHLFGRQETVKECKKIGRSGVLLIKVKPENEEKIQDLLFDWVLTNKKFQACFVKQSDSGYYGLGPDIEEGLSLVNTRHSTIERKYVLDLHKIEAIKPEEGYLDNKNMPNTITDYFNQIEDLTWPRWRRTTITNIKKTALVTRLSARDFDSFILKEENLVVVNYCNEYQNNCKTYKPVFEEIAREVKAVFTERTIYFGHMNVANNEHDLNIKNQPRLVFYRDSKPTGITFDGDNYDADEVIDFMEDYLPNIHSEL